MWVEIGQGKRAILGVSVRCLIVINGTLVHVHEAIELSFGVVSGVSRGMDVLDGVHIWQGKGRFGDFFHPIGLNGSYECVFFKQNTDNRIVIYSSFLRCTLLRDRSWQVQS